MGSVGATTYVCTFPAEHDAGDTEGIKLSEKTVSITCIAAVSLWGLSFALVLAGTVVALIDHDAYLAAVLALMAHGLVCSAAAATVSIRFMFKKQARFLRSAFDLGRDAGPAPVRSMR